MSRSFPFMRKLVVVVVGPREGERVLGARTSAHMGQVSRVTTSPCITLCHGSCVMSCVMCCMLVPSPEECLFWTRGVVFPRHQTTSNRRCFNRRRVAPG